MLSPLDPEGQASVTHRSGTSLGVMGMRRLTTLSIVLLFAFGLAGANVAQAATLRAKPPGPSSIVKIAPRGITSGGTVRAGGARAGVPAHGRAAVVLKAAAFKAFRAALRKREGFRPAPHARGPAHGRFTRLVGSASTAHGHVYWNGSRWVAPAGAKRVKGSPHLLVPRLSGSAGSVLGHLGLLEPVRERSVGRAKLQQPEPRGGGRPGVRGRQR